MSERLFLLLIFTGGAVYLFFGLKIEAPFAYDPLGPRAFPVILGICLLALCLLSAVLHEMSTVRVERRVVSLGLAVLFYLLTFRLLGFMLATTLFAYAVARLVGCGWMEGLLTGLVISICFYAVFHFLLGVPLPLGALFRLGG